MYFDLLEGLVFTRCSSVTYTLTFVPADKIIQIAASPFGGERGFVAKPIIIPEQSFMPSPRLAHETSTSHFCQLATALLSKV
jgi:hypothetical protein